MEQIRLYPIGEQDFKEVRKGNRLYIDKTAYVYNMAHDSKYVFLSRPRRFGKSLLVSTLKYYFEGCKELFKGLAIEQLETEWTPYPVLRFDLSRGKKREKESLRQELVLQLMDYENLYGRIEEEKDPNQRLAGLIKRACQQTGRKVVVLIDEYDAPMLNVIHNEEALKGVREEMRDFYSPLKASTEYLRFVFLTGVTKFSQLSIFSEFNNIDNISMDEEYAAICGITKKELTEQMDNDIHLMAKKTGMSVDETLAHLIENYDGYHFTWPSPDIFNPYSLLKAFQKKKMENYWFETATPAYVIELIRKYNVKPAEVGNILTGKGGFNVPIEDASDYIPLFYQTGYLTIKDYDPELELYTLDIPNKEVRVGLMDELVHYYLPTGVKEDVTVALIRRALARNDIAAALQALQALQDLLPLIPYTQHTDYEGHYQQLLFLLFMQAGAEVDLETHTATGRIDLLIRTRTRLYIIELKLDKSASSAMGQINRKNYPRRFANCNLPIVKVGVNIDSKERNIRIG